MSNQLRRILYNHAGKITTLVVKIQKSFSNQNYNFRTIDSKVQNPYNITWKFPYRIVVYF